MQKYGQEGFFHLPYMEPKRQSDSHNQAGANDFQRLIWIFWVCRLSPVWYNVDCSQLMSRFGRYQLQLVYPTMKHRPERNLQHKTWQTILTPSISHSTFSICCTNLFLHFSCVFTFLEIIKHNMPKMLLFSSIFNIKMPTQKFSNFDKSFLNARWYDSCHIQSNKIVLNEVKDNLALLKPSYGKNRTNLLANRIEYSPSPTPRG